MISPPPTPARSLIGKQRFQPGPFLVGQIMAMQHEKDLPHPAVMIRGTRSDMEAVAVKRQGEAVPMAVAVGTASVAGRGVGLW